MPEDIRRLNIRVSEDTHYWLNFDAARHGKSLQEHLAERLDRWAEEVGRQFGNVRPQPDAGKKGGEVRYPRAGSAPYCQASVCAEGGKE